jgi:FdrA protein
MKAAVLVRSNRYYDSVALMAISQKAGALPGVMQAVVAMGTDMNKELLRNVGLLTAAAEAAGPTDLIIAIGAADEETAQAAAAQVEEMLKHQAQVRRGAEVAAPRSLKAAVRQQPDANLAFISVPGAFAAREARLALESGLHVMLYSDNVPLEQEVALKRLAHEKGLLLMGPDCGTAIIGGVGLGFANAVRRGPVGIVAASGTGAQELSTLIDRLGSGISHLIGVGGRDLSPAVGGIMMLDGLRMLEADPETKVIVLVSKPPAPEVARRVTEAAQASSKPVILCLLGVDAVAAPQAGEAVRLVTSLDEAAEEAVGLAAGRPAPRLAQDRLPTFEPGPGRRYVRGLFSGGTLCEQALLILEGALGPVACNVHPDPSRRALTGPGHLLVDFGDDEFTRGRPHPMIDMTLRRMRLAEAASDPEVAVVLLDVVLGYGAHPDPAGALADAIGAATAAGVRVVASVTGTEGDPQRLSSQVAALEGAGALVLPTARQAALVVAESLRRR